MSGAGNVGGSLHPGSSVVGIMGYDCTRVAGVAHRVNVSVVDKCVVPTLVTIATAATGGSLEDATTYNVAASPGNIFGAAGATNILAQATGADVAHTHSITLTVPQVVGATFYDIFLSVDAAPKWVGRITEAQRAAGDFQIATYGVVTAGGGNAAGTVLLGCVGTGLAMTADPFIANQAYITSGITGISCIGKSLAYVHVNFVIDDLRSQPTLSLAAIFESSETPAKQYLADHPDTVLIEDGLIGESEHQVLEADVGGASKVYFLVDSISGQNAKVSIWVELL